MSEKRFIFHSPTRDMEQFKAIAAQAARLKKYGKVIVIASEIAEKGFHEIPAGGSGWHEYAVNSPGLHRLFPHPLIAPHVPADFVKKNQQLMLAKAKVLADLGVGAAYWGVEPYFIVESFWREYPHLRGPRVDHPRRSRQEEYSICPDLPESQEIVAWMAAELRKNVPNLEAFIFKTNDAGGSMCWANALYAGIQGPKHCQSLSPGQHIANFVSALHKGFEAGGGDVTVVLGHANFWGNEIYDIKRLLPPNTVFTQMEDCAMGVGSMISGSYPVRGMFNPLDIIGKMERLAKPNVNTVFMDFRSSYDRANETPRTTELVLDIVEHAIANPTSTLMGRLQSLQKLVAGWADEAKANEVFEALYGIDQGLKLRAAAGGRLTTLYCGVSLRHLTRPLVWKPSLLSEQEESYFLPHVFNVDMTEAREDYIDIHGGRIAGPSLAVGMPPAWNQGLAMLESAAAKLEAAKEGPLGKDLFNLATSVRIYIHVSRSTANFYFGQLLRDKYADRLAGEPKPVKHVPGGTDDLCKWNLLMREEMDNTTQLISLLEQRGTAQIVTARDEKHQDTFVLGPNLVEDLKKKVAIMRDHWLDAEGYLQPPLK